MPANPIAVPAGTTIDVDALAKVLEAADSHAEGAEIMSEEPDPVLDDAVREIHRFLASLTATPAAGNDRYDEFPDHPLHGVPQAVLDAARAQVASAVAYNDVDAQIADPLADAVVAALLPWLDFEGTDTIG